MLRARVSYQIQLSLQQATMVLVSLTTKHTEPVYTSQKCAGLEPGLLGKFFPSGNEEPVRKDSAYKISAITCKTNHSWMVMSNEGLGTIIVLGFSVSLHV